MLVHSQKIKDKKQLIKTVELVILPVRQSVRRSLDWLEKIKDKEKEKNKGQSIVHRQKLQFTDDRRETIDDR